MTTFLIIFVVALFIANIALLIFVFREERWFKHFKFIKEKEGQRNGKKRKTY